MNEAEDVGQAPLPRAVSCRGHAFDEHLACRCGKDWWAHQLRPTRCPVDAQSQNRHLSEFVPTAAVAKAGKS